MIGDYNWDEILKASVKNLSKIMILDGEGNIKRIKIIGKEI